jgi:hypothetical protein
MSRLIGQFNLSATEILRHGDNWQAWVSSGNALAAYFCGDIINELINESPHDRAGSREVLSRPLVEQVDVNRLVEIVDTIPLEDFYSVGHLLDRLCFSRPSWGPEFTRRLNWDRMRTMILSASSEYASAIDKMIDSIVMLNDLARVV